jgi:hypothetical protein
MAMEMVLRRMKIESGTVRGFRAGFRDWAVRRWIGAAWAAYCEPKRRGNVVQIRKL